MSGNDSVATESPHDTASTSTNTALADSLLVVPTHVLHIPLPTPAATLYLPFNTITAHKPSLTVGALYHLYVGFTTPSLRVDDNVGEGGRDSASRILIRLQPLLPSHRPHLHALHTTDSIRDSVPRAAVCLLLHAQLSHLITKSPPPAFYIRTRQQVKVSNLVVANRVVFQPHALPALSSAWFVSTTRPASASAGISSAFQQQLATHLTGCAVTLSSLVCTDHLNHIKSYSIATIEPSQPSHTVYILNTQTTIAIQAAPSSTITFPSPSQWLTQVKRQVCGYDTVLESIIITMHRTLVPPSSRLASLYPAPRTILLHGLPGTGKSLLAQQICHHSTLPCLHLSAADLYQKLEGEGEERIEATFAEAAAYAAPTAAGGCGGACVIVDDVDTICPEEKDDAGEDLESGGLERALIAAFCRQLDELHFATPPLPIFVFFTTSRLTRVSPSLLRQGRIDRRVHLPALSPPGRLDVLRLYSSRMTFVEAVDEEGRVKLLQRISDRMHGYVAADVEKLCREVSIAALTRVSQTGEPVTELRISENDTLSALQAVRPANLSELEYRLPKDVTTRASSASPFADLAGLDDIIAQLQAAIIRPLLSSLSSAPSATSSALPLPSGLLLYGSTGVGKTSLALALALSSTLPPLIIQSTSLVSSVLGQTEKNITQLFNKARASAPCVLVIDQLDNLGQRRGGDDGGGGGGGGGERMVACLLAELDGIGRGRRAMSTNSGGGSGGGVVQPPVFVIATSGHPELLDPALLRPGRLDYHCHIPPPSQQVRQAIVSYWLQRMPVSDDATVGGREKLVSELAERMEGGSGADIAGVMREAGLRALRRSKDDMDSVRAVDVADFLSAASEMRPSLRDVSPSHPPGDHRQQ